MNFPSIHPSEQIVSIMQRIYNSEMTTLSGGNLSIMDEMGQIWITPAGLDKGNLESTDIVCVTPNGDKIGHHRPSSEYPFHKAIYEKRPNFKAVVHAHPPALIAYSISGKIPETRIMPKAHFVCGPIRYAPYALTGSEQLGENIANTFSKGVNIVILENHGVVCGGKNLLEAYQRLETLDLCANILINAQRIGEIKILTKKQLQLFFSRQHILPEINLDYHTSKEQELREKIVEIVHRACDRKLMISTEGVISAALNENSFLITPAGRDRQSLDSQDIVLIQSQKREKSKIPSCSVNLHREIYQHHPEVGCVITSQSPNATAFAVGSGKFNSRIIPESYILLRDVSSVDFDLFYTNPREVAQAISASNPVLLIENDCVLTTGSTVLEAFDRLEVLEYSAKALLMMPQLGGLQPINEERLQEIDRKFFRNR